MLRAKRVTSTAIQGLSGRAGEREAVLAGMALALLGPVFLAGMALALLGPVFLVGMVAGVAATEHAVVEAQAASARAAEGLLGTTLVQEPAAYEGTPVYRWTRLPVTFEQLRDALTGTCGGRHERGPTRVGRACDA